MFPRSLVLSLLLACNPVPPGSEPGTSMDPSTTSGGTDGVSSSSAADTLATTGAPSITDAPSFETTTAADTTSGDTTMEPPSATSWTTGPNDDTTEGFVCNWNPEAPWFCPHAAAPNASLSGATPLGPIDFKYAYFGLSGGCVDCPNAPDGAIVFFREPDDTTDFEAESLRVTSSSGLWLMLTLAGEKVAVDTALKDSGVSVVFSDLHVPSVVETNPPLDPDASPILSGKLSITGGGWNVSGEFTATLCQHVDQLIPCA